MKERGRGIFKERESASKEGREGEGKEEKKEGGIETEGKRGEERGA